MKARQFRKPNLTITRSPIEKGIQEVIQKIGISFNSMETGPLLLRGEIFKWMHKICPEERLTFCCTF